MRAPSSPLCACRSHARSRIAPGSRWSRAGRGRRRHFRGIHRCAGANGGRGLAAALVLNQSSAVLNQSSEWRSLTGCHGQHRSTFSQLRVHVRRDGRGGGGESACTPDSVRDLAVRWRPSISAGGYPPAPAAYPGSDGRDHPPPARPCSGWGLPSHPGRPGCWCALTAPFHPYLCGGQTSAGRPSRHRRSALCCTFLRVTPTGRYPASCPVESGRSSDGSPLRRAGPYAAARPTRHRSPFNHSDGWVHTAAASVSFDVIAYEAQGTHEGDVRSQ